MAVRAGVDTGGTFTDLVAYDEQTGELRMAKALSTADDPSRAAKVDPSGANAIGT